MCKAIHGSIAGGKKGGDIRAQFESAPYGWSRDAVDGGLQVLLVAGLLRAHDERGQAVIPRELERKAIGKTLFKVESATVSTAQRIQIRKLLQKVEIAARQGEELGSVPPFLQHMMDLADKAGGEAPKPARPDTTSLDDIRLASGNEQLLALYNRREELGSNIDTWTALGRRIAERWPGWHDVTCLMAHAANLSSAETLQAQVETIKQQRLLIEEPDPVAPLLASLTQLLREELNRLQNDYSARHEEGMKRLSGDANWQQLTPEQRHQLLSEQSLHDAARPKVEVQSASDVLTTLDRCNLSMFADRVAAMPARFDNVVREAAELCEPQTQFIQIPRRMLKTDEDISAWLEEVEQRLKTALENGPVMIH